MLRLGVGCILTIRISEETVWVIYFSTNQNYCPHSGFSPLSHYSYIVGQEDGRSRHIVFLNVKHAISDPQEY